MAISLPRVWRVSKSGNEERVQSRSLLATFRHGLLSVMAGLSILTLAVLAVGRLRNPGGYIDPFAAFTPLLHMKLVMALEISWCLTDYYSNNQAIYCISDLDSGRVGRVIVSYQEEQITGVTLLSRDLWVFDLIQRWGTPDQIRHHPASYALQWDEGVFASTVTGRGRFSHHLGVKSVVLIPPMEDDD